MLAHFGLRSLPEDSFLLEHSKCGRRDLNSVVSIEKRLESEHFARCDPSVERVSKLAPHGRIAFASSIAGSS